MKHARARLVAEAARVAPRAGAWIETSRWPAPLSTTGSLPARERELKPVTVGPDAGERFATADATTASILFGERLKALRDLRRRNPEGRSTTDEGRLATFVGYHLACKATVQGRHRPSPAYVDLLRTRLTHAARFFGERARVLLRAGPSALALFLRRSIRCLRNRLCWGSTDDVRTSCTRTRNGPTTDVG